MGDVANWIDYDVNKVGQLLRNVDEDEKAVSPIYYSGQVRNMWFLTEYVANWIEHSKPDVMIKSVDEDEVVKMFCTLSYSNNYPKQVISTGSANRLFLTEYGLYEVLNNAKQQIVKFKIIMVVKVGNKLYCLLVYDNFR